MANVSEWVVREYFEMLGYLVLQPRKYVASGRQKKAEEEVDLIVSHPCVKDHTVPVGLVWTTEDIGSISRAVVAVRGWHTERFYASTFDQTPDILRFAEPASLRAAGKILGTDQFAKILCLPRLPASGGLKDKTLATLREKGVDGVLSFETVLSEILRRVDINKNYEKSDVLQVVRLLKNYGFLRDPQMDLFRRNPSRRASNS